MKFMVRQYYFLFIVQTRMMNQRNLKVKPGNGTVIYRSAAYCLVTVSYLVLEVCYPRQGLCRVDKKTDYGLFLYFLKPPSALQQSS